MCEWKGGTIALSPDGNILAVLQWAVTDHHLARIVLWEPATGRKLLTVTKHHGRIDIMAFSPDSRSLLFAGKFSGKHLIDIASGQCERVTLDDDSTVLSIAFAPQGNKYAWGNKSGCIYESTLGKRGPQEQAACIQPLANACRTLRGRLRRAGIGLWTTRLGTRREDFPESWKDICLRMPMQIVALTYSLNGKLLAVANTSGEVRLWHVFMRTEKTIQDEGGNGWCYLVFSSNGKTLAGSGFNDGMIRLWNVRNGKLLRQLEGGGPVGRVSFSADGRILTAISTSDDRHLQKPAFRGVKRWDVATGMLLTEIPDPGAALVSAGGEEILSFGEEDTVRLWNIESGQDRWVIKLDEDVPSVAGDITLGHGE